MLMTHGDQVAQEEHQVEALHLQIRQCQDQVVALPLAHHSGLLCLALCYVLPLWTGNIAVDMH